MYKLALSIMTFVLGMSMDLKPDQQVVYQVSRHGIRAPKIIFDHLLVAPSTNFREPSVLMQSGKAQFQKLATNFVIPVYNEPFLTKGKYRAVSTDTPRTIDSAKE